MKEYEIRNTLDHIVGALVYYEQSTGAEIPQGIFDKLHHLETLIFDDIQLETDRQLELLFADRD